MVVALSMKKNLLTFILVGSIAGAFPRYTQAQNCSCATDQCCSRGGYCGTDSDYCGTGCQQGPCYASLPPNNVSVPDIVTPEFFNGILDHAPARCAGKRFYTRAAFLEALQSYDQFGRTGTTDDSKREIAAFFGHVTQETGYFCYIEEIDGPSKDNCVETNKENPCNPIQLSWNFKYGPAGKSIGFEGLKSAETVASDPVTSFKSALWYWMNFVHPVIGQGFGAIIRAINPLECIGGNSETVQKLVEYYTEYCHQLGTDPGDNLTC